jgi:hypothetical protein
LVGGFLTELQESPSKPIKEKYARKRHSNLLKIYLEDGGKRLIQTSERLRSERLATGRQMKL